jgi:aquaglyceroporin related protein, other eukaryote
MAEDQGPSRPTPRYRLSSSRRSHASSFRPPTLGGQQRSSENDNNLGSRIEEQPTTDLSNVPNAGSHDYAASETATEQDNNHEAARQQASHQASTLNRQQTQKKPDDSFYVDNDYFALNPWYDQQPKRPVFGLGQPLPRTVRPGMLWGRRKLQQAAENKQGKIVLSPSNKADCLHISSGGAMF